MKAFFVQRWFLLLLACVLVLGMCWPELLEPAANAVPQPLIVAATLFCMSLPLAADSMWQALRRPKAVGLAIAINSLLLPLAAWPLSWTLPRELGIGLLVAATIPCTLASAAAWTRRAGGNDTVALLVMMITNSSCFLVTPLWLLTMTGQHVQLDRTEMMQRLAVLVVLPTLLAQLLRLWRPLGRWASSRKLAFGVAAQLGILSMVFVGAVHSGRQLGSAGQGAMTGWDWLWMIGLVVGLHTAMLAIGHLLSKAWGLSREDRIAVGFAGSQKTLMVGLDIATRYFSPVAMLPMVSFHIGQLLVDTVIADRLKKAAELAEVRSDEP